MDDKFISAKLDIVFKMLFANEKNRDILKEFLSDMLDIPLDKLHNIRVKNPEINPEFADEKYYRLDLNIDIGNQLVNIELQVRRESYYSDRTLLYWSKLYSSQLEEGSSYNDLCPCIVINIVDYIAFKKHDDFHSKFEAWDIEHYEKLSDKMEIHFFELKKIKKNQDISDRKKLWLRFIKADTREEFAMLENIGVPAIEKGVQALYDINSDEKAKEYIRMREKALLDEISELEAAKNEGRAEGIKSMIAGMRAAGFTEEQIEAARNAAQ